MICLILNTHFQFPPKFDTSTSSPFSDGLGGEEDTLLSALKREALESQPSAFKVEDCIEASTTSPGLNASPHKPLAVEANQAELHLEIPSDLTQASVDHKDMSFALSEDSPVSESRSVGTASGGASTPSLKRKDSFYESDEELKTPRKPTPRSKKTGGSDDEPSPPAYDSAISTADSFLAKSSPLTVSANMVSRTSPSPSTQSSSTTSPRVIGSSPPSPPQVLKNLSSENLTSTVVVTSSAMPLPSYDEATCAISEAMTRGNIEVDEHLTPDVSQAVSQAPIAKLDTTDSDSDQVPYLLPF